MRKKEIIVHLICWLAFSVLIFYWQSNVFDTNGAMLHTARAIALASILFYLNLLVLLPRFFEKGQYLLYGLCILLCLVSVFLFFDFTAELMPRPEMMDRWPEGRPKFEKGGLENSGHGRPGPFGRSFMFTAVNTIPILLFSTILWLTNETRKRKQLEIILTNEKLQSEMRFLKSQINPHFLFNALNNIYSLSITQSEKTPQMIMKLSEMLRHVVYDSTDKVPLEKEISYINNFIDFQNLKMGNQANVSFDYSHVQNTLLIEPMLLTPFVENAFKHSDIDSNPEAEISILLETRSNELRFEVINTLPTVDNTKDSVQGIGIQNVSKRLDLAYPGKSSLEKKIKGNTYCILLTLICK